MINDKMTSSSYESCLMTSTIYPRLILDVDRYHRRHDSLELKKQLTHVVEQLAATAPDEFKTVSSVLDFLHMTSYAQVVNETHRGIIENVITHTEDYKWNTLTN